MTDIVVIGGGISGSLTALELATSRRVLLIEAAHELLPDSCTSRNQCFKLHTGMHYLGDIETAKACLIRSIAFARAFPDCIVGGQNLDAPYRRGRHFVMKNSLVTPDQAISVATALKELYIQQITIDPQNQVFGAPDNFFRILSSTEYSYLSSNIPYYDENGACHQTNIALGFETAESLVDFESLRRHIRQKIASCPNICVLTESKITEISANKERGYCLQITNRQGEQESINAPFVVNCAWQNIELLSKNIPAKTSAEEQGINRAKITILVNLPDALRSLNTCLFSTGPYCSITILENGDAILASERLTNVGYYSSTEKMPQSLAEEIRNKTSLHTEIGQQFARQILDDCSAYFNPTYQAIMNQSIIKEMRVGFVKHTEMTSAYTKDSIYRMGSIIHSRLDTGVRCVAPGYITNASMKMIYAKNNATLIKEMIEQQTKRLDRNHNTDQSTSTNSFFMEQAPTQLSEQTGQKPQSFS